MVARFYLGTFLIVFGLVWFFNSVTATEVFLLALAAAGLIGCLFQGAQQQAQQLEQRRHSLSEVADNPLEGIQ